MPLCSACHTWIRSSHCSLESLCWSITLHKERAISKTGLCVLQYSLMLIFAIVLLKNQSHPWSLTETKRKILLSPKVYSVKQSNSEWTKTPLQSLSGHWQRHERLTQNSAKESHTCCRHKRVKVQQKLMCFLESDIVQGVIRKYKQKPFVWQHTLILCGDGLLSLKTHFPDTGILGLYIRIKDTQPKLLQGWRIHDWRLLFSKRRHSDCQLPAWPQCLGKKSWIQKYTSSP